MSDDTKKHAYTVKTNIDTAYRGIPTHVELSFDIATLDPDEVFQNVVDLISYLHADNGHLMLVKAIGDSFCITCNKNVCKASVAVTGGE